MRIERAGAALGGPVRAPFDGVRVFSATMMRDREQLGERITGWLARHDVEIVDIVVRQSSDAAFHCITIVLFFRS
jgi:hypothetical protein